MEERPYLVEVPMLDKKKGKGEIINLHYIGKRYYTIGTFTKEALRYGVSRAMPANVIKTLKWGDKVYTAFYEKDKKGPYALVFGYFIVTGLNVTNPLVIEEAKKDKRLKVEKKEMVSSGGGGGTGITRGCGSYVVAETAYVRNTLEELVEILEDTQKRLGVKAKLMVAGRFYSLEPFAIRGAPFTRGLVRVLVPQVPSKSRMLTEWKDIVPLEPEKPHVKSLQNYELGKPSKKRKKRIQEKLESLPLDKWVKL